MTPSNPPVPDPQRLAAAGHRLVTAAEAVRVAVAAGAEEPPDWRGSAAAAAAHRRIGLTRAGRALERDSRTVGAALVRAAADLATAAGSGAGGFEGVDARLAAVLDAAGRGADPPAAHDTPVRTGTPAAPSGAPGALDPVAVARWWAGLDEPTREALRRDRPELVGGLDGVPARDRDRANRQRLDAARGSAESERGAALAALAHARSFLALAAVGVRLAEVHRRLAALGAVATAAQRPGRALLDLDLAGPDVRAAVAQGDVDTAGHVGVFTPGFTADVSALDQRLDELGGVAGPDTAMVAWYDYDAPQWSGVTDRHRSVAVTDDARVGAARLSRFLTGLDAARGPGAPDAQVTAIGHSYGSLTTALAVAATPGVDDAVYLGSPGLGGAAPGPPGHAWVGEAAGDPVADLGWFGPDPNRLPGVRGLSAGDATLPDGRILAASHGHRDYLRAGTTSAHNVAAVVGGRPDEVVADRDVDAGDRLRAVFGG